MTDSKIVTLLFTDLVGHTEVHSRLGDDAWEHVRRTHFSLLRDAVRECGGQEVKNLGDGLMVAFPSAVEALRCAARMQQSVDRHNRRGDGPALGVRIGLNAGEPIRDEADYFGISVTLAKRLCDAASGGQILAAGVVRSLVAGRETVDFEPLAPLNLKGIADPVQAWIVRWEPAPAEPIPLPATLLVGNQDVFVGRANEIMALEKEWERATGGARALVVVAGEPGIGKTRLVAELAARAHADGATVLVGRCDEEGLLPYQPFVEGLKHYVQHMPVDALRGHVGDLGGELARLVPELGEKLPDLAPSVRDDPESERYRLFRAVATLLEEASATSPVLLILDDLHWADRPTLALLKHVLRGGEGGRLLVCGTYRDVELDRRHPLTETLATLRREHPYERVVLRGLSGDEVFVLLEEFAQHELGAGGKALADAMLTNTEGNPFFVWEILRNLIATRKIYQDEEGRWTSDAQSVDEFEIPEGVREAIGRRLSRLSDEANQALSEAAVLGRRFDHRVLEKMSQLQPDALLSSVEEALAANLLAEEAGGYTFTHALVRQALYDELSVIRRQRLHGRAANALEAEGGNVGALASHFRQAGSPVDPVKAIEYSLRAAQEASGLFALDEAEEHLRAALELMDEHGGDAARRGSVLAALANAVWYTAGPDDPSSLTYLTEALQCFEEVGDEVRAAQIHSTIGRNHLVPPSTMDIPRAEKHLRAAEAVLCSGPVRASTAVVYTGLAGVRLWSIQTEEGLEFSNRALEAADHLGHNYLRAIAAVMHGWLLTAGGSFDEGLDLLQSAWDIADEVNHIFGAFDAAWIGSFWCGFFGDPRRGIEWAKTEIESPRQAQAAFHRRILKGSLAWCLLHAGEVAAAKDLLREPGVSADLGYTWAPVLEDWDGNWSAAAQIWETSRLASERVGNLINFWGALLRIGQNRYYAGDLRGANESLDKAFALSISRPMAGFELETRLVRALVLPALGAISEARSNIDRIRELTTRFTHAKGVEGRVDLAAGVLAEAEGAAGAGHFARARALLETHAMPWWEAEACLRESAFDDAIAIYERIGAGRPYVDRVLAVRSR